MRGDGDLRSLWLLGTLALCAVVALFTYRYAQSGIQKTADNQAIVGAISATFGKSRDLKVGELKGDVQSSSTYSGTLLTSAATMRAPYAIDYYVDLSKVRVADMRWNEAERTLSVTIPDVRVGTANIDVRNMTIEQKGLFVSRAASAQMVRSAVSTADRYAVQKANDPKMLNQARANGREAVHDLLAIPMRAMGRGAIKIDVRYASEGQTSPQLREGSTPISEVIQAIASAR